MYAQADLRLCWSHIPHCWKSHVTAQIYFFRTEMQIFSLNWMMQSVRFFNVCEAPNVWTLKSSCFVSSRASSTPEFQFIYLHFIFSINYAIQLYTISRLLFVKGKLEQPASLQNYCTELHGDSLIPPLKR